MDFGIKTFLSTAALGLLLSLPAFGAEVFYVPAFCEPSLLKIHVQNPSSTAQRLWTQVRGTTELEELHFDFDSFEKRTISGEEFLGLSQGFSIKTWQPGILKISVQCDQESLIPLGQTTSPEVTHYFPRGVRSVKFNIQNLAWQSHPVLLTAYSLGGAVIGSRHFDLKDYDTQAFKWTLHEDMARVEVRSEGRLHSWAFFPNGVSESFSPGVSLKPVVLEPDLSKTYFLVATRDARPSESYVVGFSDPEQIKTARAQINTTGFEKILVARLQIGHGGFNRNYFSKDHAPYSWSVSEVDAFADFAHISCDGSPDLVEERLMQYVNDGGRICFWRYRIVRELSASEVSSGFLANRSPNIE